MLSYSSHGGRNSTFFLLFSRSLSLSLSLEMERKREREGESRCLSDRALADKDSKLTLFGPTLMIPSRTIRVWRAGRCVETLTGHASAVQAVLAAPEDEIVSGESHPFAAAHSSQFPVSRQFPGSLSGATWLACACSLVRLQHQGVERRHLHPHSQRALGYNSSHSALAPSPSLFTHVCACACGGCRHGARVGSDGGSRSGIRFS